MFQLQSTPRQKGCTSYQQKTCGRLNVRRYNRRAKEYWKEVGGKGKVFITVPTKHCEFCDVDRQTIKQTHAKRCLNASRSTSNWPHAPWPQHIQYNRWGPNPKGPDRPRGEHRKMMEGISKKIWALVTPLTAAWYSPRMQVFNKIIYRVYVLYKW